MYKWFIFYSQKSIFSYQKSIIPLSSCPAGCYNTNTSRARGQRLWCRNGVRNFHKSDWKCLTESLRQAHKIEKTITQIRRKQVWLWRRTWSAVCRTSVRCALSSASKSRIPSTFRKKPKRPLFSGGNEYDYEEEPGPRHADHRRDARCHWRVIRKYDF